MLETNWTPSLFCCSRFAGPCHGGTRAYFESVAGRINCDKISLSSTETKLTEEKYVLV